MSSTEWLVENLAKVPVLVIPCYEPTMPRADGDESFYLATLYGSIFPAVWNFQLALHTRGYGTCITTLHLHREKEVRELLGIPESFIQGCLLPVGRLRSGYTFTRRRPAVDRRGRRYQRMGGRMTTDAELRERITRLEDRAEIRDCMMRYARGMDRRDRELLRSAYHDGAVDDHVGFVGEVDDFIDWAFALPLHPDALSALPAQPHRRYQRRRGTRGDVLPLRRDRP